MVVRPRSNRATNAPASQVVIGPVAQVGLTDLAVVQFVNFGDHSEESKAKAHGTNDG